MRVLLYVLNYYPEIVGVGKYSKELTDFLSINGHQIRVVTSNPYYPEWKINQNKYKTEKIDNTLVLRSPIYVPKKPNAIKRILHLLSFSISSIPNLIRQIIWRPERIIVFLPTIFITPNVIFFRHLYGKKCKIHLHIQDLEIDAAKNLGIIKFKKFDNLLKSLEVLIYKNFDKISTISEDMRSQLRKKISNRDIQLIRNWIDLSKFKEICNLSKKELISKFKLNIEPNKIILMYSGSLNKKQDISILIDAIKNCSGMSNIHWILSIEGQSKIDIVKSVGGFKNVLITNLQPSKLLNYWLAVADIHLLPQKSSVSNSVMPSKLIGILASGRPVIATANKSTELGRIVKKVGFSVKPNNLEDFIGAIKKLCFDKNLRESLGQKASNLASEIYDKDKILYKFLDDL